MDKQLGRSGKVDGASKRRVTRNDRAQHCDTYEKARNAYRTERRSQKRQGLSATQLKPRIGKRAHPLPQTPGRTLTDPRPTPRRRRRTQPLQLLSSDSLSKNSFSFCVSFCASYVCLHLDSTAIPTNRQEDVLERIDRNIRSMSIAVFYAAIAA